MPARNRQLQRGLSWPLTSTDIRSVLPAEGVGITFWSWAREGGELLRVDWRPEFRSNYGSHDFACWWETFEVWVSPLPSARRAAARQALRAEALPALVEWIAAAGEAPEGWRLVRHSRSWYVADDGAVSHRDDRS